MKIAEVVGSYLHDELTRGTPSAAVMQQIAAAFTPSGRVKAQWDAPGFAGEQEPEPRRVKPVTSTAVVPSSAMAGEVQPVDNMNAVPRSGLVHPGDAFQRARTVAPNSALRSGGNRWR